MNLGALSVSLESDHFATSDAILRSLHWDDALSRSFRARIEIEVHTADYDGQVLLGSDLRVVMARGTERSRKLCGVVASVREVGALQVGVHLALEVVPGFELLALRRRSRIFQDKTVPEIVADVLGSELGTYGRSFSDETAGTYKKREYCVQYQESDRDFVQRLLEEEGIWFAFDHAGDVEEMKLFDENASAPRLEGGEDGVLPYRTFDEDVESVQHARLTTESTPTSVANRQYDFTKVANNEATDEGEDGRPNAERYEHGHGFTLTLADFSGTAYGGHDTTQRAKVWREGYASGRIRLRGRSSTTGLTPGLLFELTDHPVEAANVEYLLVSVVHTLTGSGNDQGPVSVVHDAQFDAQPSDRPFRPARVTPRPVVNSIETAIVVGAAGEEIHTDEHGRIKVQFHWDRDGGNDEHSSIWLRCAQNWAGAGWGWIWTPRIGMEVIVRFDEGDPDRPLATGTLYTSENTPPYALPGEKTKSTIKSNSSIGGGGFNELRFEDKAGSEEIFQHAQKNLDEVVLANHSTNVGAHQKNEVDKDQKQVIDGDQTETIATTQDLVVGADRKVTVKTGFKEKIDGSQTRTVLAGSTESISDHELHEVISGGVVEVVTGKEGRTVTGGQTENLHDFHGQIVTGAVTETVTASMYREGSTLLHDGSAKVSMTGTAGIDMNGFTSVKIKSPNFRRITAQRGDTANDVTITSPMKYEAFLTMIDIGGLKGEDYNRKLDINAIKYDLAGFSMGAYIANVTMCGFKAENEFTSGAEFKMTVMKLLGKAKYEKKI